MNTRDTEMAAFYRLIDEVAMRGEFSAGAELIDFPLLVSTSGRDGVVASELYTKEQWLGTLKPRLPMDPHPEMEPHVPRVVAWVGDSVAVVEERHEVTLGSKRSSGPLPVSW